MLSAVWYDGGTCLDLTNNVAGAQFATGRHGYVDCTLTVVCSLAQAFYYYNRPGVPRLLISNGCDTIFDGRVEDVAIVAGGARIKAFGYWRALSDVPYTALWSTAKYTEWEVVPRDAVFTYVQPERYEIDFNDRLYIAPRKNEKSDTTHYGTARLRIPDQSGRNIVAVSFDYDFFGDTTWRAEFTTNSAFVWTLNGNGASQTGSVNTTFTGDSVVYFNLYYNNATPVTYTGETGDRYLKITNLRIKTTTSASVYASEIAGALAAYVAAANAGQLSSATVLIDSPALDLTDEVYEDQYPADILERLAGLGDNASPPNLWEAGVYEAQRLYFRARGGIYVRQWYVDAVAAPEIERTLDALYDSAYAVYQDANNLTVRTATAADADSIAANGVTRTQPVRATTANATQAAAQRDAALADGKTPTPRLSLPIGAYVHDASGALCPSYLVRAGDILTVRNLPPSLGTSIDRIRSFRIAETAWTDGAEFPLTVVPESPAPSLDLITARAAAGIIPADKANVRATDLVKA